MHLLIELGGILAAAGLIAYALREDDEEAFDFDAYLEGATLAAEEPTP